MPTNGNPAGRPIFNRFDRDLAKAPVRDAKPSSLDAQADQIRKSWLQRTSGSSK
jgi:hypothetical protein